MLSFLQSSVVVKIAKEREVKMSKEVKVSKKFLNIVINRCYGGFGVSEEGVEYIRKLARESGMSEEKIVKRYKYEDYITRHDKFLVQAVKDLGEACNGSCASLVIEQIEYEYKHNYKVSDDDGNEEIRIYETDDEYSTDSNDGTDTEMDGRVDSFIYAYNADNYRDYVNRNYFTDDDDEDNEDDEDEEDADEDEEDADDEDDDEEDEDY